MQKGFSLQLHFVISEMQMIAVMKGGDWSEDVFTIAHSGVFIPKNAIQPS